MVRALFTEVKWPVGALGLALVALIPGLLLLGDTDPPTALAWGLIAFGIFIGALSVASFYFVITSFLEQRRNAVTILDEWHCYYRQQQLQVSIPMDIISEAPITNLECIARLDQEDISLKQTRRLEESLFVRNRYVAEYVSSNVPVPQVVDRVRIAFSIRLSDGVSKKETKTIPIQ